MGDNVYCDRCGREHTNAKKRILYPGRIERGNSYFTAPVIVKRNVFKAFGDFGRWEHYDLCADCYRQLDDLFMRNENAPALDIEGE